MDLKRKNDTVEIERRRQLAEGRKLSEGNDSQPGAPPQIGWDDSPEAVENFHALTQAEEPCGDESNTTPSAKQPNIWKELNARFVERAKPGDLRQAIRRLALRTSIDGRYFGTKAFIEGQHGFAPCEILHAARRQLNHRTKHLHESARLRVRYFCTAQMCPQVIRDAIYDKGLCALTILPGFGRQFGKGCIFKAVDALQVMTLNMRRNRPNDCGMLTDHFDIRLHTMELDRNEGVIRVGGSKLVDDQPFSRTVLSRDFSREPGRSNQSVPRNRVDVIEAALGCIEALESAAVSNDMGYQSAPILPKVYLGFKDGAVPRFDTPALRRSAMSHLLKWMRRGLAPEQGSAGSIVWQLAVIPKLLTVDPDSLEDWTSMTELLGPTDAGFLLDWMLEKGIIEHDGLHLVPASFFPKDAIKGVMADVDEVFVRVNDHLGREQFTPEGALVVDRRYAKLQVMQLDKPMGEIGTVKFDFSTTEVGKEGEFE